MHLLKAIILAMTLYCLVGCSLSQEEINRRNEYIARAKLYFTSQKYLNSLQQLNLALAIDPTDKRALVSKGWTLFYLEKPLEAQEWFKKSLEEDDSDSWTHYGLASTYFRLGTKKYDKAQDAKNRWLKSGQKNKELKLAYQKHHKDAEHWLQLSLKHYNLALDYDSDIYDLHKMIASVHTLLGSSFYNKTWQTFSQEGNIDEKRQVWQVFLEEGMPHYDKALSSLGKYIELVKNEIASTETFLNEKEKERKKVGLTEKEHQRLDLIIDNLRVQLENSKERFRIGHGLAAEMEYQLAILYKQHSIYFPTISNGEEKVASYTQSIKKRMDQMMVTSPTLRNVYRNLAKIAELQGDYQAAVKYMQEYVKRYPMSDPRGRVIAQEEFKIVKKMAAEQKKQSQK